MRTAVFDLQPSELEEILRRIFPQKNLTGSSLEELGLQHPENIQTFDENYHLIRSLTHHYSSLIAAFLTNDQFDSLSTEEYLAELLWFSEHNALGVEMALLKRSIPDEPKEKKHSKETKDTKKFREQILENFKKNRRRHLLEKTYTDFKRGGFIVDGNRDFMPASDEVESDVQASKLTDETISNCFSDFLQTHPKIVASADASEQVNESHSASVKTRPIIPHPEIVEFLSQYSNQHKLMALSEMILGIIPYPNYLPKANTMHFHFPNAQRCVIDLTIGVVKTPTNGNKPGSQKSTSSNLSSNQLVGAELMTRLVLTMTNKGLRLGVEFCRLEVSSPELFYHFFQQNYFVSNTFNPPIAVLAANNLPLTSRQLYIAEGMMYLTEVEEMIRNEEWKSLYLFQLKELEANAHTRKMSLIAVLMQLLKNPDYRLGKIQGVAGVRTFLEKTELLEQLEDDALVHLASESIEIATLILQRREIGSKELLRRVLLWQPSLFDSVITNVSSFNNATQEYIRGANAPLNFIQLILSAKGHAFSRVLTHLLSNSALRKQIFMTAPFELQLLAHRFTELDKKDFFKLEPEWKALFEKTTLNDVFALFDKYYQNAQGRATLRQPWLRDYFEIIFESKDDVRVSSYRDTLSILCSLEKRTPSHLSSTPTRATLPNYSIAERLLASDHQSFTLRLFYKFMTHEKNLYFTDENHKDFQCARARFDSALDKIPGAHLAMFLMTVNLERIGNQYPEWAIQLVAQHFEQKFQGKQVNVKQLCTNFVANENPLHLNEKNKEFANVLKRFELELNKVSYAQLEIFLKDVNVDEFAKNHPKWMIASAAKRVQLKKANQNQKGLTPEAHCHSWSFDLQLVKDFMRACFKKGALSEQNLKLLRFINHAIEWQMIFVHVMRERLTENAASISSVFQFLMNIDDKRDNLPNVLFNALLTAAQESEEAKNIFTIGVMRFYKELEGPSINCKTVFKLFDLLLSVQPEIGLITWAKRVFVESNTLMKKVLAYCKEEKEPLSNDMQYLCYMHARDFAIREPENQEYYATLCATLSKGNATWMMLYRFIDQVGDDILFPEKLDDFILELEDIPCEHILLLLMQSRLNPGKVPQEIIATSQKYLATANLCTSSKQLWSLKSPVTLEFIKKTLTVPEFFKLDRLLLETFTQNEQWLAFLLRNFVDFLKSGPGTFRRAADIILNLRSSQQTLTHKLFEEVWRLSKYKEYQAQFTDFCARVKETQEELEKGSGNDESVYVLFDLLVAADNRSSPLLDCKSKFNDSKVLPSRLLAFCQLNQTDLSGEILVRVYLLAGNASDDIKSTAQEFRTRILRDRENAFLQILYVKPLDLVVILEDLIYLCNVATTTEQAEILKQKQEMYFDAVKESIPKMVGMAKDEMDALIRATERSEQLRPLLNRVEVVPAMLKYCVKYADSLNALIVNPSMNLLRDGLWNYQFDSEPSELVLKLIVLALGADQNRPEKIAYFNQRNGQFLRGITDELRNAEPSRAHVPNRKRLIAYQLRLYNHITLAPRLDETVSDPIVNNANVSGVNNANVPAL